MSFLLSVSVNDRSLRKYIGLLISIIHRCLTNVQIIMTSIMLLVLYLENVLLSILKTMPLTILKILTVQAVTHKGATVV